MVKNYISGLDRVLWTHHSSAIEGNTLTLGETYQVLTEGLTINGKPLVSEVVVPTGIEPVLPT
jgi:Fic family protein